MIATLFRTLNRIVRPVVQAGAGSPTPFNPGAVVLETTGRVSGLPRRVPLLALTDGCYVYVSTARNQSQWVRNLEADPTARLWLHGRVLSTRPRVFRTPVGTIARLALR